MAVCGAGICCLCGFRLPETDVGICCTGVPCSEGSLKLCGHKYPCYGNRRCAQLFLTALLCLFRGGYEVAFEGELCACVVFQGGAFGGEAVFGAFGEGGDFGVVQAYAVFGEYFG